MYNLAFYEHVILAAATSEGIITYDIEQPASPNEISVYNPQGNLRRIAQDGDIVLVEDVNNCVRLIDISDPYQPEELSTIGPFDYTYGIDISDGYAYASYRDAGNSYYVLTADISDPTNPDIISLINPQSPPLYIIRDGNYLYTAGDLTGLLIYNVQNPYIPVNVAEYPVSYTHGLSLDGDYLYLSGSSGVPTILYVFNVADPEHPALVTSITAGIKGFDANGGYLYGYSGNYLPQIVVMDVSNPGNPVEVNQFCPGMDYLSDLHYQAGYLYLAGGSNGLRIYDIRDALNPVLTGTYMTPGNANGVTAAGVYAYVADDYYFGIYDCDNAVPVAPGAETSLPENISLCPVYPNPFNPSATIRFHLSRTDRIALSVFDLQGRTVQRLIEGYYAAGEYQVLFAGEDLSTGLYFARLEVGEQVFTQKMLLLK